MSNRKSDSALDKKPILAADHRRLHLGGFASKTEANPEIMRFVIQQFETDTFESIARKCAERFGPALAPGKSSVHRFWKKYFAERVRQEYVMKPRKARAPKK